MAKRKQTRGLDIDELLADWEYEPGEVNARLVHVGSREVVQMRIEMGVVQMEVEGRPDGTHPGGAETYYDYLIGLAIHEGEFTLTPEQCEEVDREFLQFYQRRICWIALREFERAVADADHNLALMEFVRDCSPSEEWTASHEQYRPFVLFHRAYAAAMSQVDQDDNEAAIDQINAGIDQIGRFYDEFDTDGDLDEDEMVVQLKNLRESLREHYDVGPTLSEQLAIAIENEEYELAARIRDRIAQRED